MPDKKKQKSNLLVEQSVRNDEIFCSLLFDENNSTLRVVDFRGGNLQQKQAYLERVQLSEGLRKIFTLIERDDMHGWQRAGYLREGSIPGYYKRSDAYIMGMVNEDDWDHSMASDEAEDRKEYLNNIRELAKEYEEYKATGLKGINITEEEAPNLLRKEFERRQEKAKKTTGKSKKVTTPGFTQMPLFMQFSREVEYYHYAVTNKRTKQINLFSAEYQDCFGNAKINTFFDKLSTKTEIAMIRVGISAFVDWLAEIGAVAIFALVDSDNIEMNAIYASIGFKNSGWMNRQVISGNDIKDQILWTQKLLV